MAKDKDRKKKLYFGLLIIFLMVSSTIGFMYGGDSGVKKINGQKFVKVDGGWQLYIDEIESYWKFSYLPTELGFDPELLDFSGSELNVYSSNDLSKNYEERLKFVLLYKGVLVNSLQEEDCGLENTVWILDSSSEDISFTKEEKCLYITGDLNKLVDGIAYKIFGVI